MVEGREARTESFSLPSSAAADLSAASDGLLAKVTCPEYLDRDEQSPALNSGRSAETSLPASAPTPPRRSSAGRGRKPGQRRFRLLRQYGTRSTPRQLFQQPPCVRCGNRLQHTNRSHQPPL